MHLAFDSHPLAHTVIPLPRLSFPGLTGESMDPRVKPEDDKREGTQDDKREGPQDDKRPWPLDDLLSCHSMA